MGVPVEGSSAIIGPDGRILSASETPNEELILADLDLSQITKAKTFADASGHCTCNPLRYCSKTVLIPNADSRPDLLWLGCDERQKRIIRTTGI